MRSQEIERWPDRHDSARIDGAVALLITIRLGLEPPVPVNPGRPSAPRNLVDAYPNLLMLRCEAKPSLEARASVVRPEAQP